MGQKWINAFDCNKILKTRTADYFKSIKVRIAWSFVSTFIIQKHGTINAELEIINLEIDAFTYNSIREMFYLCYKSTCVVFKVV